MNKVGSKALLYANFLPGLFFNPDEGDMFFRNDI
jgi:hypothetical protein